MNLEEELAQVVIDLRAAEQHFAKELKAMCGCSPKGRARNKERKDYERNVIEPLRKRKLELEEQLRAY